jgi:hypothetical protein
LRCIGRLTRLQVVTKTGSRYCFCFPRKIAASTWPSNDLMKRPSGEAVALSLDVAAVTFTHTWDVVGFPARREERVRAAAKGECRGLTSRSRHCAARPHDRCGAMKAQVLQPCCSRPLPFDGLRLKWRFESAPGYQASAVCVHESVLQPL